MQPGRDAMSWFEKLIPSRIRTEASVKRAVPEGIWAKCPGCRAVLYRAELERNLEVCPKCHHHNRIGARRRLDVFLDAEPREEIGAELESTDPLKFKDLKKYKDRLSLAQKQTDEKDALVVMRGQLKGIGCVAAAFEFNFMGGSMGSGGWRAFCPWRRIGNARQSGYGVLFPRAAAQGCRSRYSRCCRCRRRAPHWAVCASADYHLFPY